MLKMRLFYHMFPPPFKGDFLDLLTIFYELVKSRHSGEACAGLDPVTGVQSLSKSLNRLDSGFRRNYRKRGLQLFTNPSYLIWERDD